MPRRLTLAARPCRLGVGGSDVGAKGASVSGTGQVSKIIGLYGAWPPGWGGIAVHLLRVANRLTARGYDVAVLDTEPETPKPKPALYFPMPRDRTSSLAAAAAVLEARVDLLNVHVFGAQWKTILPFFLLQELTGVPVVVTMHSLRNVADSMPARDRRLFSYAARRVQHFLCAGEHVRQNILRFGVEPTRATTIVPFISPVEGEPDGPLAPEVEDFLQRHRPIVTSGTGVLVHHDERDLYGLDVFVRAAHIVKRHHPSVGFFFVVAGVAVPGLIEDAEAYIAENDLADTVVIHRQPIVPGTRLWQRGDVFVRATLSDGDAISLREALAVGVPALASTAVSRPDGCALFETGDVVDCARGILALLSDPSAARARVAALPIVEGFDTILDVFQGVLAQPPAARRLSNRVARQALTHWRPAV